MNNTYYNLKNNDESWIKVIDKIPLYLHQLKLSNAQIAHLLKSTQKRSDFIAFMNILYSFAACNPHKKDILNLFFEKLKYSHFTLSEWIEAINFFSLWCEKKSRKGSFDIYFEYLNCVEQGVLNELTPQRKFSDHLASYLKLYGLQE